MQKISYQILDSLDKIKREDWDSVFGDLPEGYQFYKTLEESRLEGFSFYYIVMHQGRDILLIAPLFITDFNLDIAAEGSIEKIIRAVRKLFPRLLILKTLFCGSPFAEHGSLGIRRSVGGMSLDSETKKNLLGELLNVIYAFCRKKNIPLIIFKDFLEEETLFLDDLKFRGFFKVQSFPSVVTELNFGSFQEYLKSLSSSTRKNLRRKIKRAYSQANITVEIRNDCEGIVDDVLRLYENTYHGGSIQFERLNRDFFVRIGHNLKPYAKFFLYYVDKKLAAFNLCFVYKDILIDKFIGFDYDVSRRYNLYFASWSYNIEWCLKNSIRYYQTGQTDYYPKMQLGGRLVPLYAYLRHRNRIANLFLRILARFLSPDNFDPDIRSKINV